MILRRLALSLAVCALASPAVAAPAGDADIVHVLNRVAFGPSAADVAQIREIGIDRYIAEQLNPESIPRTARADRSASPRSTHYGSTRSSFSSNTGRCRAMGGPKPTPEEQKARRQRGQHHRRAGARRAGVARTVQPAPARRGDGRFLVQPFQRLRRQRARPSVGRQLRGDGDPPARARAFPRPACCATAQHPAMLFYLDNWQNSAPGSQGAERPRDRDQRELRPRVDGAAHARRRWRLHARTTSSPWRTS